MIVLIFILFILLIIMYVYYKTYESFEVVTDGETFINRDNSLEDINYAKECLNTILNDFNENFNKTYVLNDIIKLDKSYIDNNIIIYNLDINMHNTTDYLNKPYKISFKVDNNIIELINIT